MLEIAAQIIGCLLIAALLGAIIGYIIGRMRCKNDVKREETNTNMSEHTSVKTVDPGVRPRLLISTDGKEDDLKQISGVGPKLEKVLNELGIYTFSQIAEFTDDNVQWLDNYLAFQGRIKRDKWIDQAAALENGKDTDFSKRYKDDK